MPTTWTEASDDETMHKRRRSKLLVSGLVEAQSSTNSHLVDALSSGDVERGKETGRGAGNGKEENRCRQGNVTELCLGYLSPSINLAVPLTVVASLPPTATLGPQREITQ